MGNVGGSNAGHVTGSRLGWHGRNGIVGLLALSVVAVLLVMLPSRAGGALPGSPPLFQLDGNALAAVGPPTYTGDDWDQVYGGTSHANDTAFITQPSTVFGQGSKDTDNITGQGGWACAGGAPNKNVMANIFAATYTSTDPASLGHTIVYFGADRDTVNGDSNLGFWFLQDPNFGVTVVNGNCTFSGVHKVGDIFVSTGYANGGTQPTVSIYKWNGSGLTALSTGDAACTNNGAGQDECAIGNTTDPVTAPWPEAPFPPNGFVEGGIDLNTLDFGGQAPPCFTNFLGETRSSDALNAELKNFGAGNLNTCGTLELKKVWDGPAGQTNLAIGTSTNTPHNIVGPVAAPPATTTGPQTVSPGTYHLSEDLQSTTTAGGWHTDALSCVGGSSVSNDNISPANGTSYSVTVGSGESVVCTYTNHFNPFNPTISTTLVPTGPVSIGTQVHDTATLLNPSSDAGGTVTYRYYASQADCTADTTHTGGTLINTVTVTNGSVPQSSNVSFSTATTVYFQAVYSGDSKNNGAVSACSSEPMTINPNSTSISTTLVPASPISIGQSVHDTATLTGATSNAGGTVDYRYYTSTLACSNDTTGTAGHDVGSVTVTNGVVPASATVSFSSAQTVYWRAIYSGDTNNLGSKSTCSSEQLIVNPNNTSISTTLVPASPVVVGTTVHDTANLSGNTSDAGGTVTYRYYATQAACTADTNHSGGTLVNTVTVTNGVVPASNGVTFNTTGTVYWQAVYSGDGNNNGSVSTCASEPLTINPKVPTIATNLQPGAAVAVGTSVHDTATISNATSDASGSVDYRYYTSQSACTADTNGTGGTDVGSVTVASGVVPQSASVQFNTAQTVYWRAIYSGDGNNQGAKSDCASEQLSVVDAKIVINPLTATNEVGSPHVFTVTVMKNTGSGFVPAAGEAVTATATASNGATITSAGGTSPTCVSANTTDANGQCTVTVNSSTGGKITVHASVTLNVAGVSLTRATGDSNTGDSPNGVKTYVDARIVISPLTATNEVGHSHVFTVTVTKNLGDGAGFVAAVGVPVTATATASGGATITSAGGTSPTCVTANATNGSGQCTITVNSSTAGLITVSASTTFTAGGVSLTRTTGDSKSGDSADGVKTYVDANIVISPLTPTNEVGTAHTFTVTVMKNSGSGFVPAAGVTVTATATASNGATITSAGGTSPACNPVPTGADGTCTIVVNSSTGGKITVHATTTFTVGGISLTRSTGDANTGDSADAVKTYVDANIAITPLTPTNEVGTAHTFTVTVQKNTGSGGFVPANGETITATVTGSNGATVTNAHPSCVGIANSPATVTDAAGKCTIVVNSSTAGKLTVNASVTLSVGGVSLTRSTGDQKAGDSANAVKTYVDSYITISPATAQNNVNVTHTFTVQVFTNDGSSTGYVGSNGQTVTFTLLAGSVGSFTGAAPHTCTTQTIAGIAGQCTITTVSTVAGTDHMQATTTLSVGGVSMTRTTGTAAPGHANSDNATKTWVKPSIGITKNPKSQTFVQGGTATFTIVVTNTGPVTLSNVRVTDALSPDCAKTSSNIAGLASLAPGASITYTCTLANVQSSFTNSATATGTPVGGGPDVTATDTAPVTVTPPPPPPAEQHPAIAITKNPKSQSILTGQTATFTIVVTNTGDVTLTNVTVTDQLSPDCNKTSAQITALGAMAPGASVTYNCTLSNAQASFTNVAVATGTPPSGSNVTAQDSAPVTVNAPFVPPKPAPTPTHPAIEIVKDPKSQTIGEGDKATFKITVTNSGDVTLTDVQVTDPLSPQCNRNLGTLDVGQSKSYSCTRDNVKADFENVATATGKPPTGGRVSAKDNANIGVKAFIPPQHPHIAIVKSPKHQTVTTKLSTSTTATGANKTTVTYGTADFTIKVTNTGDVALHNVTVSDPLSTNCNKRLGTIPAGKSKTYNCQKPAVTANYTNIATATGTSPKGVKVHATDHANVVVTTKTTSTSGAKFTG